MIFCYSLMVMMLSSSRLFAEATTSSLAEFLITKKIFEEKWQYVNLTNVRTKQIGTWGIYESNRAIDRNGNSFNIACKPCDGSLAGSVAWWRVNFYTPHWIVAIQLLTSTGKFSNTLRDFDIFLSKGRGNIALCSSFQADGNLKALTKISVTCDRFIFGNQLVIYRSRDSQFRPDILSIAEIRLVESVYSCPELERD